MKKLLALVLALVMTMGLATVGASAAFADADKVDSKYAEAVDLASMLGIIEGNGDNTFAPNRVLTRGEAAKFIAYLDLGKEAADALSKSETRFSDVPTGKWYTGYITYCADQGYITGYGNGKFGLTDKLTGNAFGAYVLAVLGYDRKSEGMTGSKWQSGVSRLLSATGIGDSIAKAGTAKLTRQEAAQYIEDALKTEMVEYVGGLNVTTPDGTQVTNSVRATPRKNVSSNLTNDLDSFAGNTSNTLQLGEKLYRGQLKYDGAGMDDQGRPTTGWSLGTKTAATASKAAYTTTAKVASGDALASAVKAAGYTLTASTTSVTPYINGSDTAGTPISTNDNVAALTGNGTKVELYADDSGKINRAVVLNERVVKITKDDIHDATSTTPRYVTLETFTAGTVDKVNYISDTLAAGDVVAYTYDVDTDTDANDKVNGTYVLSLDVLTATKGTYDRKSTTAYTFGGTPYTAAAAFAGLGAVDNAEYNVYTDKYGYVIRTDVVTKAATPTTYAYVTAYQVVSDSADLTQSTSAGAFAKLIFTDGTTETVKLKITSGNFVEPKANGTVSTTAVDTKGMTAVGNWFTYTKNSDGTYTLGAIPAASAYVMDADASLNITFTGDAMGIKATTVTYYLTKDTEITAVNTSASAYKASKDTGYGTKDKTIAAAPTGVNNAILVVLNGTSKTITGIYAVGQEADLFNTAVTTATYAYGLGKDSDVKGGETHNFAVDGTQKKYDIYGTGEYKNGIYTIATDTDPSHNGFYTATEAAYFTGTVTYVDGTSVIINVDGGSTETTYKLASDAKIFNMYTTTATEKGTTLTALAKNNKVTFIGSGTTLNYVWVTAKE